jgi:hypothetical protein
LEEVLGYEAKTLIGSAFTDMHAAEDRPQVEAMLRQVASGLTIATFEAQCRRRDNSFANISWSIQSSPHHHRIFCVGRDSGGAGQGQAPWQTV